MVMATLAPAGRGLFAPIVQVTVPPLGLGPLRQAQVRDSRVHDARRTAATLLIEQGIHIRVVQDVLGHTRVTTTERYTHVATLQMKDASERMDQALWGQG
jgi:integrase